MNAPRRCGYADPIGDSPAPVQRQAPQPAPSPAPVQRQAPQPAPVQRQAPQPAPQPAPVQRQAPQPAPSPAPVADGWDAAVAGDLVRWTPTARVAERGVQPIEGIVVRRGATKVDFAVLETATGRAQVWRNQGALVVLAKGDSAGPPVRPPPPPPAPRERPPRAIQAPEIPAPTTPTEEAPTAAGDGWDTAVAGDLVLWTPTARIAERGVQPVEGKVARRGATRVDFAVLDTASARVTVWRNQGALVVLAKGDGASPPVRPSRESRPQRERGSTEPLVTLAPAERAPVVGQRFDFGPEPNTAPRAPWISLRVNPEDAAPFAAFMGVSADALTVPVVRIDGESDDAALAAGRTLAEGPTVVAYVEGFTDRVVTATRDEGGSRHVKGAEFTGPGVVLTATDAIRALDKPERSNRYTTFRTIVSHPIAQDAPVPRTENPELPTVVAFDGVVVTLSDGSSTFYPFADGGAAFDRLGPLYARLAQLMGNADQSRERFNRGRNWRNTSVHMETLRSAEVARSRILQAELELRGRSVSLDNVIQGAPRVPTLRDARPVSCDPRPDCPSATLFVQQAERLLPMIDALMPEGRKDVEALRDIVEGRRKLRAPSAEGSRWSYDAMRARQVPEPAFSLHTPLELVESRLYDSATTWDRKFDAHAVERMKGAVSRALSLWQASRATFDLRPFITALEYTGLGNWINLALVGPSEGITDAVAAAPTDNPIWRAVLSLTPPPPVSREDAIAIVERWTHTGAHYVSFDDKPGPLTEALRSAIPNWRSPYDKHHRENGADAVSARRAAHDNILYAREFLIDILADIRRRKLEVGEWARANYTRLSHVREKYRAGFDVLRARDIVDKAVIDGPMGNVFETARAVTRRDRERIMRNAAEFVYAWITKHRPALVAFARDYNAAAQKWVARVESALASDKRLSPRVAKDKLAEKVREIKENAALYIVQANAPTSVDAIANPRDRVNQNSMEERPSDWPLVLATSISYLGNGKPYEPREPRNDPSETRYLAPLRRLEWEIESAGYTLARRYGEAMAAEWPDLMVAWNELAELRTDKDESWAMHRYRNERTGYNRGSFGSGDWGTRYASRERERLPATFANDVATVDDQDAYIVWDSAFARRLRDDGERFARITEPSDADLSTFSRWALELSELLVQAVGGMASRRPPSPMLTSGASTEQVQAFMFQIGHARVAAVTRGVIDLSRVDFDVADRMSDGVVGVRNPGFALRRTRYVPDRVNGRVVLWGEQYDRLSHDWRGPSRAAAAVFVEAVEIVNRRLADTVPELARMPWPVVRVQPEIPMVPLRAMATAPAAFIADPPTVYMVTPQLELVTERANAARQVATWLAHELGHAFWHRLSPQAHDAWIARTDFPRKPFDVRAFLALWRKEKAARTVAELIVRRGLADGADAWSDRVTLLFHGTVAPMTYEQFRDFAKSGTTLSVPDRIITGYASTRPEEAFCEALSLLVAYGPRTLHRSVQVALSELIPSTTFRNETLR